MPTPAERNALIFLASLGLLGVGVRIWRTPQNAAPAGPHDERRGNAALDRQIAAVDSAAAGHGRRDRGSRARRDSSSRSPRAAPAPRTALRGPAASTPVTAPAAADPLERYEARRLEVERLNRLTQSRIERENPLPTVAPPGVRAQPAARRALVDLDTADSAAVVALPMVGPMLAARILADRRLRGPFGSLAGLGRVRGIGPWFAERLRPFVTFSAAQNATPTVTKFHRQARAVRRP